MRRFVGRSFHLLTRFLQQYRYTSSSVILCSAL
jgi:hypothetical protein